MYLCLYYALQHKLINLTLFIIILLILYTHYSTMCEMGLLNTLLLFQIQDN